MSDITLKTIDNDIKDVINNLFGIQTATYSYTGPESQEEILKKVKGLTIALQRLSTDTKPLPDPLQVPEVKDPENPPLHSISIPPEIVEYVDSSRNPDIYTREFVELVQRENQELKGKADAFADFCNILAREIVAQMPELQDEVKRTLEAVGEGPIKDPDAIPDPTKPDAQHLSTQGEQNQANGLVNPQGP